MKLFFQESSAGKWTPTEAEKNLLNHGIRAFKSEMQNGIAKNFTATLCTYISNTILEKVDPTARSELEIEIVGAGSECSIGHCKVPRSVSPAPSPKPPPTKRLKLSSDDTFTSPEQKSSDTTPSRIRSDQITSPTDSVSSFGTTKSKGKEKSEKGGSRYSDVAISRFVFEEGSGQRYLLLNIECTSKTTEKKGTSDMQCKEQALACLWKYKEMCVLNLRTAGYAVIRAQRDDQQKVIYLKESGIIPYVNAPETAQSLYTLIQIIVTIMQQQKSFESLPF